MTTNPAFSNNAIDHIGFGLILDSPFDVSVFSNHAELNSLRLSVGEEFIDVALLEEVEFNEADDSISGYKIIGFEFRTSPNEELNTWFWSIKVVNNTISVTCKRFSTWTEVWKKVESICKAILSFFSLSTFKIKEAGLQCIDRFNLLDDISVYNPRDIFNTESDFFSRKVLNSGPSWHLHHGWFESHHEKTINILHNLNFNASIKNDTKHFTTIDHVMKIRPMDKLPISYALDDFFSEANRLSLTHLVHYLYILNKRMMREILSDSMKTKIGLANHE